MCQRDNKIILQNNFTIQVFTQINYKGLHAKLADAKQTLFHDILLRDGN